MISSPPGVRYANPALWVGDSLLAKPRLESVTLLSALAAITTWVRLGVGCMVTFAHRHPVLLAQQWASLDVLSHGRSWLVVCLGGPNEAGATQALEHAAMGIQARERIGRLEEGLVILRFQVRSLWAHAGISASATTVGGQLDRFSNLAVELALRSNVAPDPTLDPERRAVFLRHLDRFMVGTDTWVTLRWDMLVEGMQAIRGWARELPREVAEQTAHRNAERLFTGP